MLAALAAADAQLRRVFRRYARRQAVAAGDEATALTLDGARAEGGGPISSGRSSHGSRSSSEGGAVRSSRRKGGGRTTYFRGLSKSEEVEEPVHDVQEEELYREEQPAQT